MKRLLFLSLVLLFTSCTKNKFKVDKKSIREIASNGSRERIPSSIDKNETWVKDLIAERQTNNGTLEFPPGLNRKEAADLWHLGEGSEFYPLKWMYHLKSETTKIKDTLFLEKLDEKFGVIKDPYSRKYGYPLEWIGLSAAWTDSEPKDSDVLENKGRDIHSVWWDDRNPKIAVAGVNCSFCHTSEVDFNGKKIVLDGAPSNLYIRGFFQDLMVSTIKTMLVPEMLEEFIIKNGHDKKTAPKTALKFSTQFKRDLGLESENILKRKGAEALVYLFKKVAPKTFDDKSQEKVKRALFEKRDVVTDYLGKLVLLTYDFKGRGISRELRKRLERMSIVVGADPDLAVTQEGYTRTDAFGRISNLVARINDPAELTATTSVPHMWGIKYKSLFHWNANTNSVMNRNIGQSFGLGAVLTNQDAKGSKAYDSTSNLHNLARLEKLLYKLEVPSFEKNFGVHEKDDLGSLEDGCETYAQKCMNCHRSDERVGPTGQLIHDHMIPHRKIETDSWYTKVQKKPVEGVAFKNALFDFVNNVKVRYYERYNVGEEEKISWQNFDIRGPEVFRDTYLGESSYKGANSYVNISKEEAGYPARSLAGIWATAPYFHNGSIPSIMDVLKHEDDRPEIFFVGSNKFNPERIGFHTDMDALPMRKKGIEKILKDRYKNRESAYISLLNRRADYQRELYKIACNVYPARCFNAREKGNSNKGHSGEIYGTNLPLAQKKNLIKFLKYLKPHVEYSWKERPLYKIVKEYGKARCEFY